ncbi:uncharacterized protein srxn1 isoform X2 [Micropterus dolomieu]|uniref:uncharacterized protein srxn1 isoform X2 n=1 Tax=Micropterus dolomieu TaxID=147949 RepID=UPI001E8DE341|nr:uncharacterized protein srxn1 isoform X2 [Micropterus dolomieu]
MFRLWHGTKTQVKLLVCRNTSTMSTQSGTEHVNRSIHSDTVEEVHNVPVDVIIRPIPPVLDELKVQSLMNSIKRLTGKYSNKTPTKRRQQTSVLFLPLTCSGSKAERGEITTTLLEAVTGLLRIRG